MTLVLRAGWALHVGACELVKEPLAILKILVLERVPPCLRERAEPELHRVSLSGTRLFSRVLPVNLNLTLVVGRHGGATGEPGPIGGEARGVRCGGEGGECEPLAFCWAPGAVEVVRGEGYRLNACGAW